ncbi:MAG: hypothetical protein ACTS73_04715 [Arsenophonus sp. NEOnobi-MAG3]
MEKQTVIQKETLSLLIANIKLHLISWLADNLSDHLDSCIEAKQLISLYPAHIVTLNILFTRDIH